MKGISFETRFNIVKIGLFTAGLMALSLLMEYTHLSCREFIKSPSLCDLFLTVNELMPVAMWLSFGALVLALAFNSIAELNATSPKMKRLKRREIKAIRFDR